MSVTSAVALAVACSPFATALKSPDLASCEKRCDGDVLDQWAELHRARKELEELTLDTAAADTGLFGDATRDAAWRCIDGMHHEGGDVGPWNVQIVDAAERERVEAEYQALREIVDAASGGNPFGLEGASTGETLGAAVLGRRASGRASPQLVSTPDDARADCAVAARAMCAVEECAVRAGVKRGAPPPPARQRRLPKVERLQLIVEHGLTDRQVVSTLGTVAQQIAEGYEREIAVRPNSHGVLALRWTVHEQGSVEDVAVIDPLANELDAQVAALVRSLRFPPPSTQRAVGVTLALFFSRARNANGSIFEAAYDE
ncbi:MAG: energy transducer TonB [Deltaproteobacteria bacterium]|nr:energy transducer TonB [Deltaproteobacteria bacterium]